MSLEELKVHIGEVKIGDSTNILSTILGSCVGIVFIWTHQKKYGMAHCLLPDSQQEEKELSGRYVDQAIPTLLKMMEVPPNRYHEISAVLAGGANMTRPENTDKEKLIGYLNQQSALKIIKNLKIKVIFEDFGGHAGRKLTLNCSDESYVVETFNKNQAA